ncbi:hypothetical protein [Chitinimonas koreensis]|uniref:hypothetical protein n=1 Tax=Chitinimonas koreensis TaxID=356302 RepID=UPI0003FFA40B|nr:hypothetical protein [Chitinimonas koreensis]QNM96191.1 hypothetical protein H9L41_20660 [Chitinimonas koreensis]
MTAAAYQALRSKGYRLAGGLDDLQQRACVYHHLYQDSGRRNVFPLIAAHGALWAAGYFRRGMLAGQLLSLQYLARPARRRAQLQALADFADRFRDINRRVCAESYALYHYTRQYGAGPVGSSMGEAFTEALLACHASNAGGTPFAPEQREALFREFFLWEQAHIVAPSVTAAYAGFHWPAIRYLALRPTVEFAYFGQAHGLPFADFSSRQERVEKGLQAYRRAEAVGLDRVEQALRDYRLMPRAFFHDSIAYYRQVELACAG